MNLPHEVPLPSGATLVLKMAPFNDGVRLMKAVAAELRAVGIDAHLDPKKMLVANAEMPVDLVKNVVCQALTSDALETAMWACAGRSSYVAKDPGDAVNGVAMDKRCFEPDQARCDYLLAAWEVIRFNLTPFFQGLPWKSLIGGAPTSASLKSE